MFAFVASFGRSRADESVHSRLLVCMATSEEYSQSNASARAFIERISSRNHWKPTFTTDPLAFTIDSLQQYSALLFVNNVGNTVDSTLHQDVEQYMRNGGGVVFLHASIDANQSWEFYSTMVGVRSNSVTESQTAVMHVLDQQHPSTAHGGLIWTVHDRILNLENNLRQNAHVLATVDNRSIRAGTMGLDHPISWCAQIDRGRSWVTTLGFEPEVYNNPTIERHLEQGIRWAAHEIDGDASAFRYQSYSMQTVAEIRGLACLTSLPTQKLFAATRRGEFYVVERDGSAHRKAGEILVSHGGEDGTLGAIADTRRTDSAIVYVLSADRRTDTVSVYRIVIEADTIVPRATQTLLSFPYQSAATYHVGGGLTFNRLTGDLYIGTGDNTHGEGVGGYPAMDERPGRETFDAQRTSANSMSHRGKILRIRPHIDGLGYSLPNDNLSANEADSVLPEVYAMGFRNPFRISIDPLSGVLMVGDVGPNPWPIQEVFGDVRGVDELNYVTKPGNFGWPYFVGNNAAFNLVDMGPPPKSRGPNSPNAPFNFSPNNTGKKTLPRAIPSIYEYSDWDPDSALCGKPAGRAICAGPRMSFAEDRSANALPLHLQDFWLLYDFSRGWIRCFRVDTTGHILAGFPLYLRPDSSAILDIEFTEDGELYALVWDDPKRGDAKARVVRIVWSPTASAALQARIQSNTHYGASPLTVEFDGRASRGSIAVYNWDVDGDGTTDTSATSFSWTYEVQGTYDAHLTVEDSSGAVSIASVRITVGNSPPTIHSIVPSHGMIYREGKPLLVTIDASDDHTPPDDLEYTVAMLLGHDNHAHPVDVQSGKSVLLQLPVLTGHGNADQLFGLVTIKVGDKGNGLAGALARDTSVILQPHFKEAEYATVGNRSTKVASPLGGAGAGIQMSGDGAFWSISPLRLDNIARIRLHALASSSFVLRFRSNSPVGPDVAHSIVRPIGSPEYVPFVVNTNVTATPDDMHTLYIVMEGQTSAELFVDAVEFVDFANTVHYVTTSDPSLSMRESIVSDNVLRFTYHGNEESLSTASIVNTVGLRVHSFVVSPNTSESISLHALPSGCYLLTVSSQHGSASLPFIIVR